MALKVKKGKQAQEPLEVLLSEDQRKALQEIADQRGQTLSNFLVEASMKEREAELKASNGDPEDAEEPAEELFETLVSHLRNFYNSEDEATVRLSKQAVSALTNLRFRLAQLEEDDA